MNPIFSNILSRYERRSPQRTQIRTKDNYTNALHEVRQLTTLAGLYHGGFFNHVACLCIFYGLQRFLPVRAFISIERANNTPTNPHRGFTKQ